MHKDITHPMGLRPERNRRRHRRDLDRVSVDGSAV